MPSTFFQNAVEMIEGFVFLDLGDDRDRSAAFLHLPPRVENVLAVAHEGERDQVDFVLDAESQILFVFGSSEREC